MKIFSLPSVLTDNNFVSLLQNAIIKISHVRNDIYHKIDQRFTHGKIQAKTHCLR